MLKKYFPEEIGITKRDFFAIFILLLNSFTWYYMTLILIDSISSDLNMASLSRALYYTLSFGSSIIGAVLSDKIRRLQFLKFWIALGVMSSLLPYFIGITTPTHVLAIFSFLGITFGLGMPSCLAYFADYTIVENRGRISGIIFLITNLSALPLSILFMMSDVATSFITLAIWRGLGLILFLFLIYDQKMAIERKRASFTSIFYNRSFVLYVIPWFMFNFINISEKIILKDFFGPDFHSFILMMEPMIGSFSAFAGGLLSDIIGRKKVVIYGFVSLGVAYAIIGIAPRPPMLLSWYFYLIVDGVAAGILWVTFILVLWGDLSQLGAREKYYAVGSTPFLMTEIIPLILAPYITTIPAYAAFSLASFFLFLSVLPLMYAPETLPEKKIELRRLRGYVEKAKKIREKYVG